MTRLHHSLTGDGPPVVFLHAFPMDGRMWQQQVSALAKKHYTCVTLDLSGFGRSLTDSPVHAIDDHAYDVNELLNTLHLDKVHMVGCSMGGYIALAFARRYAQRLASITLANTKAEPDNAEAQAGRDKAIALIESKGPGAFLDTLLPKLLSPKAPAGVMAQVRAIGESQPQATLMAALSAMRDRGDTSDVLKQLDVPCLMIGASGDAIMPPETTKAMHALQADAELRILEGTGHLAALESPTLFNDALTKFFESLRH